MSGTRILFPMFAIHRLTAFATSNVVLVVIWVLAGVHIASKPGA